MKVVSLVVTYNATKNDWLYKCLDSLKNSIFKTDIYIVDNASKDETVKIIKQQYQDVKLFQSKENLGFAKANNLGMNFAIKESYDFVFLLNQDAWIEKNTIGDLISISSNNTSFGILSPVHLNGEGDNLDFNFTKYMSNPINEGRNLIYDLLMNKNIKELYSVDFINAASWLIPLKTLKTVGVFDDVLFNHYGEDTNYCHRVLFNNLFIGLVPNTFIFHDRENRKGKKTISDFNSKEAIKKFVLHASNPLNEFAPKQMNFAIKNNFKNYIKSFFKFDIKRGLYYKKLYSEMKNLKKVVLERRKNY